MARAGEGGLIQVGELAKATGKTVRAIHLYEELGLLRPANRSKGRYRLFSADAELRVRWIGKLQSLGLSLTEIQDLVRDQEGSDSAPMNWAIVSRASETAASASHPKRCVRLAALPKVSVKYGSIAWSTRGSKRVVAWLSM